MDTDVETQASGFIEAFLAPKLSTPFVSTPDEFGLDFEDVSFVTTDGVTLSAWLIKGGTEKVIIQAHPVTLNRSGGLTDGKKTQFLKTAKAFVDAGFSVLMFDARNHGKSEVGPNPFIIGTIDDAPDFVAAVDYIASRPEYKNSSIGIHAICFGSNATTIAFGIEQGLQGQKNLKAISLAQPASWGMLLRNNPDIMDGFVDEINRQLKEQGSKDVDGVPLEFASKINVPTLVIQNRNDPSKTLPFVEEFFQQIQSTKEIHWVDGEHDRADVYHHLTEHPEKLIEWFSKHL